MLFFQKRNKEAEKIAREHQRPAWVRLPLMLFFFIILGALFSYHFGTKQTAFPIRHVPASTSISGVSAAHGECPSSRISGRILCCFRKK